MSGVLDIDLGWKNLLKELRGLSKKEIKAGIQGGKTKDGTADLVTVATVQEFGAMIFQHPKVKKDGSFANNLSLIHISEPTRLGMISYAVFCLKKKKKTR